MVTSPSNTTITVRYDLVEELVNLLANYRAKRVEIENVLSVDAFSEMDVPTINGIVVSQEAARIGLQAELSNMELKLVNRFNIAIGRPLPVAQQAPVEEGAAEAEAEALESGDA